MCTCKKKSVFFVSFIEKLSMTKSDIRMINHDDVVFVGWNIPQVYYSRAYIEQCSDDVIADTTCLQHDVTSNHSGSLIVSRQGGTSLRFVVYQDRDEVVRLLFTEENSREKNSGTYFFLKQYTLYNIGLYQQTRKLF